MSADAPDTRCDPLRRAGRIVAFSLAAALVALLAYGLIARSPDTTIDDALAQARPVPAPGFSLAVLTRDSLPPSPAFARAAADDRVDLRELRGTPVVLNSGPRGASRAERRRPCCSAPGRAAPARACCFSA